MKNPKAFLMIGMAALVCSSLSRRFVQPVDLADAMQGFFIAVSIGFNLMFARRNNRRCAQ